MCGETIGLGLRSQEKMSLRHDFLDLPDWAK